MEGLFGFLPGMRYFCITKFEAIHNKDNSVVKTFRVGVARLSFFFCK